MTALFTIARTWKHTKCLSTDEQIKMWYIHTMKYHSSIKKNEIRPFAATWMDLGIFILTKSERERQISHDILYMWKLKRNYTNELIYKTETDTET